MSSGGLFINSNQSAIIAENNLQNTSNALGQSLQRLSSGLRITSASVDPAGYEIAQGLNSTNLGINQATRNANNANSLVSIASGGLSTIQGMLGTMQTLATEAANGTTSSQDAQAINSEYNQLGSEITQLAQSNQFNGLHLLSAGGGSAYVSVASAGGTIEAATAGNFSFQIGYNANTTTNQIAVSISGTQASQLGMNGGTVILSSGSTVMTATEFISLSGINYYSAGTGGGVSTLGNLGGFSTFQANAGGTATTGTSVATQTSVNLLSTGNALTALSAVQAANVQVAGMSGQLGSYENRVTQILNNLQTEGQNTQAAYSQIMDVNFASQMSTYTLQSTLAQSGEAMLAQANMVPQGLLTLLK